MFEEALVQGLAGVIGVLIVAPILWVSLVESPNLGQERFS
jgi:hypothetical protein